MLRPPLYLETAMMWMWTLVLAALLIGPQLLIIWLHPRNPDGTIPKRHV